MTHARTALVAHAPAGLPLPAAFLDAVEAAYASPGRHYHTLDHVAAVARHHAEVAAGPGWRDPRSTYVAVLAHDAVYEALRPDNEARSAVLARTWCAAHGLGVDVDRVDALIRATAAHHTVRVDDDPDLALFLDCDLAILGAEPAVYDAYERGVAAEYALVPAPLYRAGREQFLRGVLAAESPFRTAWFTARYAEAARRNVERALRAPPTG